MGIALLTISSTKAIQYSIHLSSAIQVRSLMVGLILVSIGTDLPEIVNSLVACAAGHGDIDVGDSLGSILAQITLVLGLVSLLGRNIEVKRKDLLIVGGIEIFAVMLIVFVTQIGFTQLIAFLLIASWPVFLLIIQRTTTDIALHKKRYVPQVDKHPLFLLTAAVLTFVGVAIGAIVTVQSVVALAEELNMPEFLISFFVVGLGTSLPELVVDLQAIRKRHYDIAIGDVIGSCTVDALISIPIGQLFFPCAISTEIALILGLYVIVASAVVVLTLALRERIDKKGGGFFLVLYVFSYVLLLAI